MSLQRPTLRERLARRGEDGVVRLSLRERLGRRGGNGVGALLPGHGRRQISLLESFNYAVEGIIHVLRTHRNMRIHFAAALGVLVLALALGVDRFQLIALLLSIAFVLVAEMINSAIEAAIDVATSSFDPLAKLAKDIAAGAVLIASINAVVVAYLVFSSKVGNSISTGLERLRDAPAKLTIIALIIVIFLVIMTKALTGRGTPLRGGLPSGHAAVAFAAWMAVTQMLGPTEHRFLVSTIMFGVAVLVAHTRIETGIHSTLEVVYGGLLGSAVTLAVFQLFF
jgi:diacylglycerol kinase (ATP)